MNIVAHNMMSINAYRQVNTLQTRVDKSSERLSSGYKINRAADDAAGLTISEKMRWQIRGLNKGSNNIEDGISLIQVADGALTEVHDMLHRMKELAVQAANDTNTIEDRQALNNEVKQLAKEITRIGKDTTFNTLHILDDVDNYIEGESVTQIISSPCADKGYLSEAIKVGNYWFPSASLDFSNVNENNIEQLHGQGFSFCCSRGCDEVFDFIFTTDGTPNSANNLSGKVTHYYSIDISNCKNGADLIDAIYSYVANNLPTNNDGTSNNKLPGALAVSHSNNMIKSDNGMQLIIYANTKIDGANSFNFTGYDTVEAAKNAYPCTISGINPVAGLIDCSKLSSAFEEEIVNEINIQCSSNSGDYQTIRTHRVNAMTLKVNNLSLNTYQGSSKAMATIDKAVEKISDYRSELGAYHNRLEKSYNNVRNTAENLQAAESKLRDTDIETEVVNLSKNKILVESGIAILSQANQSTQTILHLLE